MQLLQDFSLFPYGRYSDYLTDAFNKFGSVMDLPIIESPYDEARRVYQSGNILDFGAGKAKPLGGALSAEGGKYFTMDSDPEGVFDFRSFEEIPRDLLFSFVFANQVLEHLTVNDCIGVLSAILNRLQKSGSILVTVPNIAHPNRQISNITHITPWGYNSLYALFVYAGYDVVRIGRYSKRHPQGIIERLFAKYTSRVYRMDWCDSIFLVASKP